MNCWDSRAFRSFTVLWVVWLDAGHTWRSREGGKALLIFQKEERAENELRPLMIPPDVELLEPGLELVLEFDEELSAVRVIRNIHEHANQVVTITLAFVSPLPAARLRLAGDRPKPLLQFQQRVGNRGLGKGCPVVKS